MTGFTVSGPESPPSVYDGTSCLFHAVSDPLKTTVQIQVVYLTRAQAQPEQANADGKAQKSDMGGNGVPQSIG